jgi:hypothetical protein
MAREVGEQLRSLAQRQPEATRRLVAHPALGGTLACRGAFTAARPHLEHGIALIDPAVQRTLALRYGLAPGVQCLAYAAMALWYLGVPDQGLARSQAACTLARELEHPLSLATARYYIQGTVLRPQADPDVAQAEACFQQALTIARHQEAKSWELRAATSLARLWQAQGKRQEAHDLLAPVYAWFTEGFDTADLREAKQLLDELSTGKTSPTA